MESNTTIPRGVVQQAAAIAATGWPVGPYPDPCGLCAAPRWAHTGDDNTGPAKACTGYQPDPAWRLLADALDADERLAMDDVAEHGRRVRDERRADGWQVSPSDAGRCPRAVWYRECPPDGHVPLPEDTRKADAGTAIHTGLTAARRALYPWRIYDIKVTVPGLDRPGRGDEYDPITATLEDWKTAGDAAWRQIGLSGPYTSAWHQALVYALGLNRAGIPVRRIRLRYIHREKGWEETFTVAYDEQLALDALAGLVELSTQLDLGIVPDRAGTGPTNDSICQRCAHRIHCWDMDAAEQAGRTPETYARFGANPAADDPDVQWAVAQAGYARQERLAAQKDENACKALVDVDAGTYGDWVVKRGATRRPDYHAAFDELVERLHQYAAGDELLADRPVTALIPVVPVNVSRKLEIEPVRKAAKQQPVPPVVQEVA